ncbi:MAG: hypothetical protein SGPRY_002598 [Prymnesium sp.]
MTVRGILRELQPLNESDGIPDIVSRLSHAQRANTVLTSIDKRTSIDWAARVTEQQSLRVSVIGCSTSAGCGANDPLPHCSLDRSWARYMHDSLTARFSDLRVRTSIYAKNAVGPSFFRFCTLEYVPADADVVLIEVMQNMFHELSAEGGVTSSLRSLLQSLQKAAPAALSLLVVWLFPKDVRHWHTSRQYQETRAAVQAEGAALLDVPTLISHSNVSMRSWYARNGVDHHPSRSGHALLGELSAWYIGELLVHNRSHLIPRKHEGRKKLGWEYGRASSSTEVCYHSAKQLPIHGLHGNWSLRDEGGEKLVEKLGYVSTKIDDFIEFEPRIPISSSEVVQGKEP